MSFAVSCLGCGGPTTQEVDPSRGVFAYCFACRGEPGAIAWDDAPERATGTGADGRTYLVEHVGGAWRWRGADYQSGAHRSMGAAKSHAEAYERMGQEAIMARKKHHEHTNGAAHGTAPPETTKAESKDSGPPAGAVEKRRYSEVLPVKLDPEKLAELHTKLVAITCEKVAKEDEIAALKEYVKGLKSSEETLVAKVKRGTEDAPVEVVEYLLPDFSIQRVRVDTGEVLDNRAAEADDLQEGLYDDGRDAHASKPPEGALDGQIDDPEATLGEGGA